MVMQKSTTPRATSIANRAPATSGIHYTEKNMEESVATQHSNRHVKESGGLLKIVLGGLFLVVSALILVIGQLNSLMTDENTLATPSGKYRLGQVYSEELSSELLITRVSDNGQLLKVNAKPDEVYPQAIEKVLYYIQQINDKAHPENPSSYVPVEFSSAMWNSDIRIKLVTQVTYQSQYHKELRIVMDSSDRIIKKDQASIKPILDEMKDYGPKIMSKYKQGYSFIR